MAKKHKKKVKSIKGRKPRGLRTGPITYSGSGFHSPKKYGKKDRENGKRAADEK